MPYSTTGLASWLAGGAVAATLLLSGCSDGLDLNGKVFDWMGVSPAAQESRAREPRLTERAPLVMPPDTNRLPAPGSEGSAPVLAGLDDADQRKVREGNERERLHLAYCRGEVQWKERVLNRDDSAPRSPYGPCPGLFGGLTNNK